MGTLLKLEWLKVRKYRAFMILLAFYLLSIFGINYIAHNTVTESSARIQTGDMDVVEMLVGQPFDFPNVWQTVSYLGGFLLIIPGLIMILLMAGEYSFRTGRQNVIDGVSRRQFIDTKIALIFIIAFALTLVVFLTGLVFGLVGDAPFSLDGIEYLGYFFVRTLGYMSVALVVVLLLKRSGVSIGIYFLYAFIVENLMTIIINNKILKGAGYFLPLKSSGKLIPVPGFFRNVGGSTEIEPAWFLAAAIIWIAACLLFCKYRFQKSDL